MKEFDHLSCVRVVSVSRWEYLLIGEILIVLDNLLVVLVGLGPLHGPAAVPHGARLVGPRPRPARHARRYPTQYRGRYRRRCTVTRLTVARLCTYLETTTSQ